MLSLVHAILISILAIVTIGVMINWHRGGRGYWRYHKEGRAVMGLLGMVAVITILAAVSTFLGPYPARPWIYAVTYLGLILAMLKVGQAITYSRRSSDDGEMDR